MNSYQITMIVKKATHVMTFKATDREGAVEMMFDYLEANQMVAGEIKSIVRI